MNNPLFDWAKILHNTLTELAGPMLPGKVYAYHISLQKAKGLADCLHHLFGYPYVEMSTIKMDIPLHINSHC